MKKVEQIWFTEDDYERNLSFSHYAGEASAYEDAAACLMQNAMGEFASGRDKLAEALHIYSQEFTKRAARARLEQRKYGDLP